jgi:hypothetical protein
MTSLQNRQLIYEQLNDRYLSSDMKRAYSKQYEALLEKEDKDDEADYLHQQADEDQALFQCLQCVVCASGCVCVRRERGRNASCRLCVRLCYALCMLCIRVRIRRYIRMTMYTL